MSNVDVVDSCPICKADSDDCKVIQGKEYLIKLRCTKCGFKWNTLNIFALPKAKAN